MILALSLYLFAEGRRYEKPLQLLVLIGIAQGIVSERGFRRTQPSRKILPSIVTDADSPIEHSRATILQALPSINIDKTMKISLRQPFESIAKFHFWTGISAIILLLVIVFYPSDAIIFIWWSLSLFQLANFGKNRSHSLDSASKFYSLMWIPIIVFGLLLTVFQPSNGVSWFWWNLLLFQLIDGLMIIPHELGHAIAAHCVGMRVVKIIVGSGQTIWKPQLLNMSWEFKKFLVGGMTLISAKSTHHYRLKFFLISLCGSLANILLILLTLQFPQKLMLSSIPGTYLFPGIIFYTSNILIVVVNLFPHYGEADGRRIPSDGLQMLTVPFLSKREIAQRVASSFVLDGHEWESRGNYEQAIASLSKAIQRNPACVQAYQDRGNVYQSIKDYQNAVKDFNLVIKLEPRDAMSFFSRGVVYYKWRKLDATKLQNAIEDFDQAIQINSNVSIFYCFRAYSHVCLGNETQALKDFTKTISLNPTANSYYNRGAIYYQQDNPQAALEDFNRSIDLNCRNIAAYYSRGNAKYELQDQSGAFQDYAQAKSLGSFETINTEDEHGFYARGIAYVRLGDSTKAMKDFQTAEALCLENGDTKLLQSIREKIKKI